MFDKFILKTQFFSYLKHLFLPSECLLCSQITTQACLLCVDCQKELPILPQKCSRCAQFIKKNDSLPQLICGFCLRKPPPFENVYTLFPYDEPITTLILRLKFQHKLYVAKAFGELMVQKIKKEWYPFLDLPHLIVPVPLHVKRLRERGFNQALEICRPIAKTLDIPIDVSGIKRIKNTVAQSNLKSDERQENIANAFVAHKNYSDLFIAVLDDVMTTGHTLRELCKVLKKHGAKKIDIWCCARNG